LGQTHRGAYHRYYDYASSLLCAYEELEGIYDELWRGILLISNAGQILEYLGQHKPPYQSGGSTQVHRALNALVNSSIFRKEQRGDYIFVEPMFQHWVAKCIRAPENFSQSFRQLFL
jgi:hypothetical protein